MVVLALHCAVCLVGGAIMLYGPLPGRDGATVCLPRMLGVTVVLAGAAFAELFGIAVLGGSLFRLIALTHASLFIVLPILALTIVVAGLRKGTERRPTRGALALALATLPLPAIGAHAAWIAPDQLVLERAELDVPADLPRALTVGVLADYQSDHIGAHEVEAIDRLMALEPDLILIPGDVLQTLTLGEYEQAAPAFRAQLARLQAPAGVYFAQGNVDPNLAYHALLHGTDVRILDDEVVRVEHDGIRIAVGGLRLSGYRSELGRAAMEELVAATDADVRLLVSHMPRAVHSLPADSGVDLVVAGHTHGGQVVLPFFGPPVTLSAVPRHVAAGGLHELDGNPIYVSRGVGMERGHAPPVRFLCPPEISLLTLR